MSVQPIFTLDAPKSIGPYSQAVAVPVSTPASARWIFCSGQIPLHPQTGEVVGADDIRVQTQRVMQNLTAVLTAAGTTMAAVVKTTIYLVDLQRDFAAVNEVYASYFPAAAGAPPARATVQVAALPRGVRVEIDAIAVAIAANPTIPAAGPGDAGEAA